MMMDAPHEEDLKVNIILRSGTPISKDKGKKPTEGEWVQKAPEKEIGFDLEDAIETFIEENKIFPTASTLGS